MYNYSIMPLDTDHLDEICEDIREQYESGVATCALFKMTLVPEGNPPVDKAKIFCEKYDLFKEKLSSMGLSCGVLVQASIGHGWNLSELFPYRQYLGLADGKKSYTVCPDDDGFCDYIRDAFATIAKRRPEVIMVDDDFRLMFRVGRGCACEKHMEMFNKAAGENLTREQLWNALEKRDEKSREYTDIFVKTQFDSLLKAARAMREGIDSVDDTIPGNFCNCGSNPEASAEIAKILAGKGNPIVLRVNNGKYLHSSGREVTEIFYRAACQIEKLKDTVDVFLDEPDTCPQNRYSTSARLVHAHLAGSILEGTAGAKHWITRFPAHEPGSGKKYRKVLSENAKFYEALEKIYPTLSFFGCRIPLSKESYFDLCDDWFETEYENWSKKVLERMGFPLYFSSEKGGAVFMEGKNTHKKFTDDEIRDFFKGTFILASDSASELIKRGFGEYLGVNIRPWQGKSMTTEMLVSNGHKMNTPIEAKELVPENEAVKVMSYICHSVDGENYEKLFPASISFKNPLGGTTVVFCGIPNVGWGLGGPFSMLNESRKAQFVSILSENGDIPVYCVGDDEIYFKAANTDDGKLFCAVFNLSLDSLDEIVLHTDKTYDSVKYLASDGELKPLDFAYENGNLVIKKHAETLDPVMLFLEENTRIGDNDFADIWDDIKDE